LAEGDINTEAEGSIVRRYWKGLLAIAIVSAFVFSGLMYSEPWSRVKLQFYNNLEEPVICDIYVDGVEINYAVLVGPNHTAFTSNGSGTFSPMGGLPGNVTLHAVMGTHEYAIDVERFKATTDGFGFAGDLVVDTSRSVFVGFLSSQSVVLVIT
jgi:hypothetical protein